MASSQIMLTEFCAQRLLIVFLCTLSSKALFVNNSYLAILYSYIVYNKSIRK